ncbi:MAG TPA: hypothetical protein PKI46_06615 [Bacteroidales bacterium]|nr:hypothetical protein [Bacteroidales bacterium]
MKKLQDMAYPADFDFNTLLALPSYEKRVNYAEEKLQRISSGSSRIVYKVDEEKVLKVAKNKKGLSQNIVESDWGIQDMYSNIVAKVFETDEKGIFLEMELAKKVTPNKFKQIFGFTSKDLFYYLYNEFINNSFDMPEELIDKIFDNEWVNELVNFAQDFDYPLPGDFGRLSTYGLVNRDGEEKIVVIDFGLTNWVWDTEYAKSI